MPRLIITAKAAQGLERCRLFLKTKNPQAAKKASQLIKQHLALLEEEPEIGRLSEGSDNMRELILPFGSSGYVALYHYDSQKDVVLILAFRHQKEAGY